HDDLLLLVDHRHAGVPLDHALAGGHLGRLVVGAIRLPNSATHASPVFRMGLEPSPNLRGPLLEALHWADFPRAQRGLTGVGEVLLAMSRHHPPHGTAHLLRFALELFARAASRLRGIAGQFHPSNRKELPPDEALALADHQHLGKKMTEGLAPRADKS